MPAATACCGASATLPFLTTSNVPVTDTQGSATTASRIYLGHFPHLVVGIRSEFRLQLLKERFADTYSLGFLGSLRCDVQVWHPESFCEIKGIIPPA